MDLIKIYEKAKEAGINIDISIEAEGYDTDQVIIKGRTITENYYESQYYARMFPLHELEYLTVRGEDIVELAMDEIIKNLRPEMKLNKEKSVKKKSVKKKSRSKLETTGWDNPPTFTSIEQRDLYYK